MNTRLYHWTPSSALGGIEMAALAFVQAVPEATHVIATGDLSGPAVPLWREAGAEVMEIPSWGGCMGLSWARNWGCFVRARDVRHLICWSPTRLPLLLAPLSKDVRCVVHLGNVGRMSLRARTQDGLMRTIFRPCNRPVMVACSRPASDSAAAEAGFAGFEKIVIPNPVRSVFFEAGTTRQQEEGALRRWGMVARLDKLKDHRCLIEAMALLPDELGLSLEIVGEGLLGESLRRLVSQLGLGSKVSFLGALPDPQTALRRWDGFVFSTTPAEGFGIAVAEAMAAGLPCVLSDLPVMHEVAGDEAYYAAAGSPAAFAAVLAEVARDPVAARIKGQAARARARRLYDARAFAESYQAALGLRNIP
jgi:glycosyltransferase involved in cell wall biosynthesis